MNIQLQVSSKKTNLVEECVITFESPPESVSDVKKQVEKQFSIPVCVQVVSYGGHHLHDNIKLSSLSIRNGDTFHVEYLAKGDCSDLMHIISWFGKLFKAMTDESSKIYAITRRGLQQRLCENLGPMFFSPWNDPTSRTYVNKLFFINNGGVSVILKVYELILQKEWNQMGPFLKYLESSIIKSIWGFTETFPFRRLLIQHNIIPMLTQSVLRVRLEEGKKICDHDTSGREYDLEDTICGSIGVLMNLTELPECRLEIASNKDILHQVSCVSVSPSIYMGYTQVVASFFSNLAYTPEAHQYIADSAYLRRLLQACDILTEDSDHLLEFFTFLFLIQVCLLSPHCFESEHQKQITGKLESFLQAHSYEKIRDAEISNKYSCSIFIPYVKLAYIPNTPQAEGTTVGKLQLVSLQFAIFALQNWLGREIHREILLKEGLLDYVVCMPQYVPPSLRPQAEELVQMVVSSPDIPEGPPKLLNLVKAKLAKMHFGLEQVLSLSIGEILAILYQHQ